MDCEPDSQNTSVLMPINRTSTLFTGLEGCLRRKRMLGYDRPERQELWWRDPEYSNDNLRKYAVAGETDPTATPKTPTPSADRRDTRSA